MIVKNNISAINTHRVLKFQSWESSKNMEKLSSGMRINRSGDDASGLAVSEKMRTQVAGLRQAERNTEDAISFIQTTEGFLQNSFDVLQRIRVLSLQSANGIYAAEDRQLIQVEVSQLIDEMDRVASQAEFNGLKLLQGDFARTSQTSSMWFHIGPNMHQAERAYVGTMTSKALNLKDINESIISLSTPALANRTIGIVDEAMSVIAKQRADLGAYQNRLEYTAKGLFNAYENTQAAESRIRDVDMAEEYADYTKNLVLSQTATAMLAHANQRPQLILQLIQ